MGSTLVEGGAGGKVMGGVLRGALRLCWVGAAAFACRSEGRGGSLTMMSPAGVLRVWQTAATSLKARPGRQGGRGNAGQGGVVTRLMLHREAVAGQQGRLMAGRAT